MQKLERKRERARTQNWGIKLSTSYYEKVVTSEEQQGCMENVHQAMPSGAVGFTHADCARQAFDSFHYKFNVVSGQGARVIMRPVATKSQ
jgi:hypothetical protein